MGIVSAPKAISIIADDVATRGMAGIIAANAAEMRQHDRQPQASEALAEINEMARRVRQSRIYNLASLI